MKVIDTNNNVTISPFGQGNSSSNSSIWTQPSYIQYQTYPYYIAPLAEKFDVTLRKVENGWLLKKDGKEFVITDPAQVVDFLKE